MAVAPRTGKISKSLSEGSLAVKGLRMK